MIDFQLLLWSTWQWLFSVLGALASMFKTSADLRLENLALRQQLAVLRRSAPKRLRLTKADRAFWVWMKRVWARWEEVLMIVKPDTVLAWHRQGFRLFWTFTSLTISSEGGSSRIQEIHLGGTTVKLVFSN